LKNQIAIAGDASVVDLGEAMRNQWEAGVVGKDEPGFTGLAVGLDLDVALRDDGEESAVIDVPEVAR
jgi:hypothetical protein